MEAVAHLAISASADLAAERGHYPSFEGSLWSKGILPIDSVGLLAAARGETLLQPDVLARVLAQPPAATAGGGLELSEREHEVLAAVARGERSKEIALRLGISERTVKAHLASIYNKLGVDSRAAAIAAAAQRGWL
jgi:DNA-binding NarL/FixJ family response regulator